MLPCIYGAVGAHLAGIAIVRCAVSTQSAGIAIVHYAINAQSTVVAEGNIVA